MRRQPLHVQHAIRRRRRGAQQLDEPSERRLRGVCARVEHRLGGEEAADRDAVQPAREPLVVPCLDECAQPRSCSRPYAVTIPSSIQLAGSPGRAQPRTTSRKAVSTRSS